MTTTIRSSQMTHSLEDPARKKSPRGHNLPWRARAQQWWQDYQWFVVGFLWLAALALGYLGFARHFAALGETRSAPDLFYLTLQLFVLESGSIAGPKGWELELARLLAPGVAGYTVVQALALIFSEQLQLLGLRFASDHVVICGLGRKGYLLARGFRERGAQVVVIEQNEGNDLIAHCREQGAIVLIGDATNQELLRQARVPKAKYLISVCGDDGTNAEVAVHARELVGDRGGRAFTSFVHIVDPQLCELLRERELATERADVFRLEFFNVFDSGGRALLAEYPPFDEAPGPPHLLVVGLGRMGESLVLQAARSWRTKRAPTNDRLRVTIIDREADHKVGSLCLRYPQLEKVCELVSLQMDVCWPQFQSPQFLFDSRGRCDVTTVYVCLDNDSLGLSVGLALLQRLGGQSVPIVVRMTHGAGLANLLEGVEGERGAFGNLHAFGLLDRTCTPDLLLGGTHEIIARAIHDEYVRQQESLGETAETDPSLVPWDELPESLQESNRHQAHHTGMKLQAVGCTISALTDWDAEQFEFTPEEVELMASIEHQRFVEERLRAGWTYAPGPRDVPRRTSPDLVPWDKLPEPEREKDRNTIRGLPLFLATAGFQIYRLKEKGKKLPTDTERTNE